jgi:hypothetical protein
MKLAIFRISRQRIQGHFRFKTIRRVHNPTIICYVAIEEDTVCYKNGASAQCNVFATPCTSVAKYDII